MFISLLDGHCSLLFLLCLLPELSIVLVVCIKQSPPVELEAGIEDDQDPIRAVGNNLHIARHCIVAENRLHEAEEFVLLIRVPTTSRNVPEWNHPPRPQIHRPIPIVN